MHHHPKIKHWNNAELETEAANLISRFGIYDNRALMIEEVVARYGLKIFTIPGLSEIAEAFIPIKDGFIFIDEDQFNDGAYCLRVRFTLAEELSHNVIHRSMFEGMSIEEIKAFQNSLTDEQYERIEQDAKYLAGALLMPEEVYRQRFQYFMANQAGSPHSQVVKLRYVMRQLSYDFVVSLQSASLRGVMLKLIDWVQYNELMELISS
ncbi:MAG: ImmA/IrrE family metallo-endopeptidase [Opitutaceae bacterium]